MEIKVQELYAIIGEKEVEVRVLRSELVRTQRELKEALEQLRVPGDGVGQTDAMPVANGRVKAERVG